MNSRPGGENRHRFDLIIAHALLDLLHLPAALPVLLQMVRPAGLFYFSINFDGATLFLPEIDPELDAQIEALYHRSMDTRITDGQTLRRQPHRTQTVPRVAGVRGGSVGSRQFRLGRTSGRRSLSRR